MPPDPLDTPRALREALQRFAAVFEQAPVAMVVGGLDDLRFTEVNAAFEQLSGWAASEAQGRTSAELQLWPDTGMRASAHERLRNGIDVPSLETRLRRRNGALVDVAFSACQVQIGGRAHFVAMLLDITLQQQARRALQHHQDDLAAQVAQRTAELAAANAALAERAAAIADLYDNAPCGYHATSPYSLITAVNQTELSMLGYSREELIGQPALRFFTPRSQQLFRERLAALRTEGRLLDMDCEVLRKDGSVLPVLVSAVVVRDAQGRHVGNRATLVDNSERMARAQQIAAMQRELEHRASQAEAATRAKSAFLANMSHEIRTPMNAIIGLNHLMARDATDPLQRSRLDKVDAAARHLLQVISEILDLSKIEAGKMTLDVAPFSLGRLLADVLDLVAPKAREKGLALDQVQDSLPDQLLGDATRLAQALINLLGNAVKFTSQGSVQLRTELLQRDHDTLWLRFAVTDTGEGIAPEVLPRLFEAFAQADASTTRRHGGTGLGLALTRHTARLMGGDAGAESVPGQGSRFWFTARLRLAGASAPRPAAPPAATGPALPARALGPAEQRLRARVAGHRVLLAEDNPVNREVAVEPGARI